MCLSLSSALFLLPYVDIASKRQDLGGGCHPTPRSTHAHVKEIKKYVKRLLFNFNLRTLSCLNKFRLSQTRIKQLMKLMMTRK